MRDIASHIYDITENSISAGATWITINLTEEKGKILFMIEDDGCGMDEAMVEAVKNPFVTSRTTRKVGMGIPLLIQNCEATGGFVHIHSKSGVGTLLEAVFNTDHIDCPPMGDLADVMVNLACGHPEQHFRILYKTVKGEYLFDTNEINNALDNVPINNLEIVAYLKEMTKENLEVLRVMS